MIRRPSGDRRSYREFDRDSLEAANDIDLIELGDQTKMLKSISLSIHQEIIDHTRLLNHIDSRFITLHNQFDKVISMINLLPNRVTTFLAPRRGAEVCFDMSRDMSSLLRKDAPKASTVGGRPSTSNTYCMLCMVIFCSIFIITFVISIRWL